MTDFFIQQAIAQVLTPLFDLTFSKHSYGFRPNRRCHDAVRKARGYISEGYRWVIDMDSKKFFDKVNHDKLMGILANRIQDRLVLKLIWKYLQEGIMINGVVYDAEEGTPQGGPLSPLLKEILENSL